MSQATRTRLAAAAISLTMALPAAAACSGGGEPPAGDAKAPVPEAARKADAPAPETLVPNGKMPFEGVLVGGQPSEAQLQVLAGQGYATVINMRLPEEEGSTDPETVERLGMDYVAIPVAGAAGINDENARLLAEALESVRKPVLIHCASGNRIGAILGLKAWVVDGASAQEAMDVARRAGITRLEPRLRELLGLDGEPDVSD